MAEKVFFLPPGVDFATGLVRGLLVRLRGQPPEAMAKVTLYVNSQRMRRRVTDVFVQGAQASFLPRMFVLSDLASHPILADLPPTTSPLRRQLDLSRLIDGLLHNWLLDPTAFDLETVGLAALDTYLAGLAAIPVASLATKASRQH